jgi:Holliday junction resolvase
MNRSWTHRKGAEFEREVQRRLAEVFGAAFVRRDVRPLAGYAPADVVAPRLWIEC